MPPPLRSRTNSQEEPLAYTRYDGDNGHYEYGVGTVFVSDGAIIFRPMNQMGLWEQDEITVFDYAGKVYSAPDLAFDPINNDVYVVAREALTGQDPNRVRIRRLVRNLDPQEGYEHKERWGALTMEYLDIDNLSEVSKPHIAVNSDGMMVVTYGAFRPGVGNIVVAHRIDQGDVDTTPMLLSEDSATLQHADVTYVGTHSDEEYFAVAYNYTSLKTGFNGVRMHRFGIVSDWPNLTPEGEDIEEFTTEPENADPTISVTRGETDFGGDPSLMGPTDQIVLAYRKDAHNAGIFVDANPYRIGARTPNVLYNLGTQDDIHPRMAIAGRCFDFGPNPGGEFDIIASVEDNWGQDRLKLVECGHYRNLSPAVSELPPIDPRLKRAPAIVITPDHTGGEQELSPDYKKRLVAWGHMNEDASGSGINAWFTHGDGHLDWTHFTRPGLRGGVAGAGFAAVGDESINSLPGETGLTACYPNPFNPTTTVQFTLANSSEMALTVFNLMGQQVAVLANGVRPAGEHAVVFDASDLPSGVYFVQLRVGGIVSTQKIMLMK